MKVEVIQMMKNSKTKRFLSAVLSVAMIVTLLTSMWVYSASAETASGASDSAVAATDAEPTAPDLTGEGTEATPFEIGSAEDLAKFRDHVNAQDRYILNDGDEAYANAHYVLTDDIQLNDSENWNPIGRGTNGISSTYTFNGTFDGKGHTISGLYFKANSNYYTFGLFGYNSGTIKNLFVKDCSIVGYFWNGVIAGINYGTIENCLTSGSVDGAFNNGGIIGINRGGTIRNCLTTAASSSHDATDGIYGSSYDRVESSATIAATIENNYYIDSIAGINVAGKVEPVSQADLESGKVTWLLQNGVEGETLVWEQDLGSDAIPQLHKADSVDKSNAVHKVTFYYYNTDTIVAENFVNEGTITAPDVNVDVDGYTVGGKWFTDEANVDSEDGAWDFGSSSVDADKAFYSNRKAIEYTITYNLGDGGSWGEEPQEGKSHPDHYTVEDANIVLADPVRDGYTFIGWTGTGITGSAESVTIETGSTGDRVYNAQYYDNENPTASIEVGGDTWTYLDSFVEFDTFFNTSQTVTITAEDNDDTNVDVWYYITNSPVEDITSEDIAWITYDGENKPVIDPEGQYVIYAKAQDDAGHIGYTGTSGIVLEITPPVISDVTDGATYCLSATFKVEDENLESVTANSDALTAAEDGITYTINENGAYTITATDKAGNVTTVSITVADHVDGETRTENVREAGCENEGLDLVRTYCANCHAIIKSEEKILPSLGGHVWGEWKTIKTAGCEDDGIRQHTCSRCKLTVSENVNHSGHVWSATKEIITRAYCYQEGLKAYRCQNCDATSEEEIIQKLPHDNLLTTRENVVPATCTQDGSYVKVVRCSMCKQETSRTNGVLSSPGHQWSAWTTATSPTCEDNGTKIRTCSVCLTTETKNINPSGHNFDTEYTVDQEPTCTVDGSKSQHCLNAGCTAKQNSEVIKAEGHKPAADKIIKNYEPATCEHNGSYEEVVVCTVCNEEIEKEYKIEPMKDHEWSDWYAFTSDVCGGDTGERRDCKVCQISETRNINKLAHAWNVDESGEYVYTVDAEPTCTAQGSESVHCTRSGCVAILDSRTIEAKGHDWSDWSIVESPDCDDSGTKMRTCQRCKTTETENLNPNGHTWNVDENGEYVYTVDSAASCTTDGSESVHCKNCEARINSRTIPAYGHTFGEWEITDSPECEDNGTMQRKCLECGYTESENINATGHVWETDEDGNEVYTVDLEPSCTTDGSKSIHCTKCDAKKDSVSIPMVDHTWGPWETVEMPDCDDEGTQQRVCQVCGTIDTIGLNPIGHEWPKDGDSEHIIVVEATCTTDGSRSILCVRCGVALESEVIPALGHDFVDGICSRCGVSDGTAKQPEIIEGADNEYVIASGETVSIHCSADCKWLISVAVDGDIIDEKYYTVSDGSTIITFTNEYLDSLEPGMHTVTLTYTYASADANLLVKDHDHVWGEAPTVLKDATCTEAGKQAIVCEVCGEILEGTDEEISALGHKPGEEPTVLKEATCTEAGKQATFCTVCGEMIEGTEEEIPALGHQPSEEPTVLKEATCTEAGKQATFCTVCGEMIEGTEEEIPALGHKPGEEPTVLKEATCTEAGLQAIFCTVCGEMIEGTEEEIPALGHKYSEEPTVLKEATCTEAGLQAIFCTVCGEMIEGTEEEIPALGHSFGKDPTVTKVPTCTEAGEQAIFCTVCGEMLEGSLEEIPALGHSFGRWHAIDAPTCNDKGGAMRECSVCGFTETRDINALGHDWADEFTIDVEPGCLTDGSKSIHCYRCDAVKDSTVIPARGSHDVETVGAKAATCTEDGYTGDQICSICGEIIALGEKIPATGHKFENGVCTVCGATQTSPVTGNELVVLVSLFATMLAGFGFFVIAAKRRRELQK